MDESLGVAGTKTPRTHRTLPSGWFWQPVLVCLNLTRPSLLSRYALRASCCVIYVAVEVTPLEVPALDERAFLLAVQNPQIVDNGIGYSTVQFRTGPNAYPYDYDVKCYAVDDIEDPVLTCDQVADETAVGKVISGNVPYKFSLVIANVTGFTDKYVDCYVTVENASGDRSQCKYAGRATAPTAVTVGCPGTLAHGCPVLLSSPLAAGCVHVCW